MREKIIRPIILRNIEDFQRKIEDSAVFQMKSFLDVFLASLSMFVFVINQDGYYSWHLLPGETIRVVPEHSGAYVSLSSFKGVRATAYFAGMAQARVEDDDSVAGISIPGDGVYLEIIAREEVDLEVSIVCIDVIGDPTIAVLKHGDEEKKYLNKRGVFELPLTTEGTTSARPPYSNKPKRQYRSEGVKGLVLVGASLVISLFIIACVCKRARQRAAEQENQLITVGDEYDDCIPPIMEDGQVRYVVAP
jgi:hypothetical protein